MSFQDNVIAMLSSDQHEMIMQGLKEVSAAVKTSIAIHQLVGNIQWSPGFATTTVMILAAVFLPISYRRKLIEKPFDFYSESVYDSNKPKAVRSVEAPAR